MNKIITIIGAGNMGQAIAKGLLSKKVISQEQLLLANSNTNNTQQLAKKADIVILAVKPQVMKEVLTHIKGIIWEDQLIISIAAGVTISSIESVIGSKNHIIRVMPNLAASVGASMSGWITNSQTRADEKNIIKEILSAFGKEVELQSENQINMVTAISGSGLAYFFYCVELLESVARSFGLSEEIGKLLAEQTLIGSGEIVNNTKVSAKDLRMAVTSKGGTTEAAFAKLEKGNFGKLFQKGVIAAYNRAKILKI